MLLRSIYHEVVDLIRYDSLTWLELLIAADEMIFETLLNEIQTFFIQNTNLWINLYLVQVLNTVFPRIACSRLRNYCIEEIIERDASKLFNSPKFIQVEVPILLEILVRDEIGIHEIDLWKSLVSWGLAHPSAEQLKINEKTLKENEMNHFQLKKSFIDFIPFIRFFHISSVDFEKSVKQYVEILPETLVSQLSRYHFSNFQPEMTELLPSRIPPILIDSNIIRPKHAAQIVAWIEGKTDFHDIKTDLLSSYRFKRIYRSSDQGISGKSFHKNCDKSGPTIVVVKLKGTDQILGGYNPIRNGWQRVWFSTNRDKKSGFLFSFDNGKNLQGAQLSKIIEHQFATYDHPWDGPCFGVGPDLWISINNKQRIGQSIRKTYQERLRAKEGFFFWDDWEVFQIGKNDNFN
ncbi:hypothetical protein G9A89_001874 [Geosiphon pyriformis]|nr:hypothetical protein G9A89_001874 [Geosiphon pyriformis]